MGERWLVCWFVCCCSPLAHSHTRALTSDSLSILSILLPVASLVGSRRLSARCCRPRWPMRPSS